MIFPVASGYIASYEGMSQLFWILTVILAISIAIALYFKDTLTLLAS